MNSSSSGINTLKSSLRQFGGKQKLWEDKASNPNMTHHNNLLNLMISGSFILNVIHGSLWKCKNLAYLIICAISIVDGLGEVL